MLELDRQKKCICDQQAVMKVLLEQATAKTSALLSEAGFWKREVEAARAEADELRELLNPFTAAETPWAQPGS